MTAAFNDAADATTVRLHGELLRFALRCRGMSQNMFAAAIGLDPGTVSRILDGKPTTARVARRIAEVFPLLDITEIVQLPGFSPAPPAAANTSIPVPAE